jgi:hypothetical protein
MPKHRRNLVTRNERDGRIAIWGFAAYAGWWKVPAVGSGCHKQLPKDDDFPAKLVAKGSCRRLGQKIATG